MNYKMEKERRCSFKFAGNLKEFIRRMLDRGYKIVAFFPMWDYDCDIMQGIDDKNDIEEIAYQALNYEHTNIRFFNEEGKARQTVSVMMTGDPWCDVVPINDWSYQIGKADIVKEINDELREELLGDEA